ncbi:ribonuclease H-like domain-containing protein [Lipomyces japonicus]|uniref:ribonuclease H-like domain-containing protein n=1 Tax=Lipomyces japonicus TaxID=56871 RepID=UPI0034CDC453
MTKEELLEWAEENDIPFESIKKAYGADVLNSKGDTNSVTAKLFASLGDDEKISGKGASKSLSYRPVDIDESKTSIGKYVALDCEFVGVGPDGKRSVLARVSMVNYYGAVIMDEFVRPEERVTDWRTWVSGVRPQDMQNAKPFKEIQFKVGDILKDRVLVGHAIANDLKVLYVSHPKRMIRDTSKHPEFRKISKGRAPALKKVAKEFLNIDIQGDEHSSIEDARACILLFRKYKDDFERIARSKGGKLAEKKARDKNKAASTIPVPSIDY